MLVLRGPPIYVRKQIVHNIHVVRRLEQQGAIFVESEEDVPEGATVVLSAHGVAPEVHRNAALRRLQADRRDLPARDQGAQRGQALRGPGLTIFLIGHAGHEEVVGTMGEAPDAIVLVQTVEDVARLPEPRSERWRTSPRRRSRSTRRPASSPPCSTASRRSRAPQGRHLLRDDEPPGGRQGARARGRSGARDRLCELLELAAPRRRDARPGRPGASDRRRVADPRGMARRVSRPSASRPAHRHPSGSSSASWTGSARAVWRTSTSTT